MSKNKLKKGILAALTLLMCQTRTAAGDVVLRLNNGMIQRTITCAEGHVKGTTYKLMDSGEFIRPSREFSFLANDMLCSGESLWTDFQLRDTTTASGGRGQVLSFLNPEKTLCVELAYLTFPDLPLVSKRLTVRNLGREDVKLEGVSVEHLTLAQSPVNSWVMGKYGRYQNLGAFCGGWDEPLVIIHANEHGFGMAVGNEAVGVMKRTEVFQDGCTMEAGVTKPGSPYPFRRWLKPGQQWSSEPVFTAIYANTPLSNGGGEWGEAFDPQRIVNTAVQKYIRLHMGARIEQIVHKPMFVYNTWVPFVHDINDELVKQVAEAAAECGVQEFVIDDGWQMGQRGADASGKVDDWAVDTVKFKGGLKPTFDYIKSLGMKPGSWRRRGSVSNSTNGWTENYMR